MLKSSKPLVIIDTDAGHDDALALMMLVKSELFNIQAITTVAGNSTIDNVTRNAQAIIDLLDVSVPLFSGESKPLKRELVTADVHGETGLDGLDMTNTRYTLTNDACQRIITIVKAHPGEVTLLTIGPLTNIAQCLRRDPGIAPLIKEIVIMGGAIDVPGNKNRVAEFNIFVDPEAADIVFQSDIPKVLVPLDPCNKVILQQEAFNSLKGTRLFNPLSAMMKHFISGILKNEGVNGALVYDALAAYYLVNPDAFTAIPMDIVIETEGKYTSGMTVAEKRIWGKKECNVSVVTEIDDAAFVSDMLSILKR